MSDSRPQVWITGLGTISCLGRGREAMWKHVVENRSGIADGLGPVQDHDLIGLPEKVKANRALAFSVLAIEEAMQQAGWTSLNADDGLIVATTTGLFLQWDREFYAFVKGQMPVAEFLPHFENQPLGQLSDAIRGHFQHSGPVSMVSSACSASTQALALGSLWLKRRRVKRCLVIGVEVLCGLTSEGFRSLQLLSVHPSKPFDRGRSGINLAEGAGALCLEPATARANGLAALSGFGFTSDGYHMTGPHPEGDGSYRAMRHALESARLEPAQVDWIHAHGTGSIHNDLSEGLAVRHLFGERQPWISSTKWLHGHALGAAGALESILVIEAIRHGRILKTRGLEFPDPEIPVRHPDQDLTVPIAHVLKNTLGFGGANAALIFSHPDGVMA